jgi:ABC-2 type transport system permease protein
MAGIERLKTWEQIGLIAWLRWRLFISMLRAPGAGAEMAARAVMWVVAIVLSAGIAVALGGAGFMIMQNRPRALLVLFWVLFLAGQFIPLLLTATGSSFDTRTLLRFPLRYTTFLLLSLSYAAFDPAAFLTVMWLGSAAVGASLAVPAAAPWIAGAVALLALVSVLLNRLSLSWMERLLARRRSREMLFLGFIMALLSIQLVGGAVERWEEQLKPVLEFVQPYLGTFPPALAAGIIEARGAPGIAAWLAAALAAWGALFCWGINRFLRALYRGEELSETPAVTAVSPQQQGWLDKDLLPFVSGPRAALLGKELRYLFRNGVTVLQLCIPFFLIIFFGLMSDKKNPELSFFQRRPEAILPSAIGYSIFISLPISHNSFSFESRGMQLLLTAPVRFREVFLAKNLALGLAIGGQGLLVLLLVQVLFSAQSAEMAVLTFAALLFVMLTNFTVGNLLSVYFPRAFDYGSFQQRQSPWSVLMGMLTQLVAMAMVYVIYAVGLWFGSVWYAALGYALLSAAMAQVYWLALARCEELVLERREVLVAQICR